MTKTFVLNLCNFNIVENVNIVGTAFWKKCKYLQNFQFKDFVNYLGSSPVPVTVRLGYSLLVENDQ